MILRRGVILGGVSLGLILTLIGVYLKTDLPTVLVISGAGCGLWTGVYWVLTTPGRRL